MASIVQAANTAAFLHDLETGELFQDEDNSNKQWWEKLGTVALLALGMGTASMVFNILAIAFSYDSAVVYPMAVIALLLAPIVMKRQLIMDDKGGMRLVQNKLRENVNTLATENNKLCGQVNEFSAQVSKLKHCEDDLAEIVKDSEQDVNSFVNLVKENEEIIEKFKKAILAQAVNCVVGAFLDSDKDESGHLDEREMQRLTYRLSELEGAEINRELFQQKLNEDSSMSGALAILMASTQKDVEPDEQVFTFFAAHL